jgi:hypothetical protein
MQLIISHCKTLLKKKNQQAYEGWILSVTNKAKEHGFMLPDFPPCHNWKLTAHNLTVWRQKLWEAKAQLQALVP